MNQYEARLRTALGALKEERARGVPERSREMAAAKREVVVAATTLIFQACSSSRLFYEKDLAYAKAALITNSCSSDVVRDVKRILVDEGDEEAFERYLLSKVEAANELYARYHARYVTLRDGSYHSDILDADWDPKVRSWKRVDESGAVSYTSSVPFDPEKDFRG